MEGTSQTTVRWLTSSRGSWSWKRSSLRRTPCYTCSEMVPGGPLPSRNGVSTRLIVET
jgi:hypothetical protein